jgi:hypothetical protein
MVTGAITTETAAYFYARFVFTLDELRAGQVFFESDFPQDRLITMVKFFQTMGGLHFRSFHDKVISKKFNDEERSWKLFCGYCWKFIKSRPTIGYMVSSNAKNR